MNGARLPFAAAKSKSLAGKFVIVGSDTIKGILFDRLMRGRGVRFSNSLESHYYEQLSSERRIVRLVKGQPTRHFERVGRVRNEALDCLTYAYSARQAVSVNLERRAAELAGYDMDRRPISPQSRLERPDERFR
jgi:phage terminase large subunit GpA-like protein